MTLPRRGDIWLVNLSPTQGREQAGRRPVLIVSEDLLNEGPAGLVIALPLTSTIRPIPTHVALGPPEGGLRGRSAILCEAIRSISRERLVVRWGAVSAGTMAAVEDRLRILLRL